MHLKSIILILPIEIDDKLLRMILKSTLLIVLIEIDTKSKMFRFKRVSSWLTKPYT